ncbi:MAG: Gfo/Idh/MocA family oxidoreductase [Clostridia bacterium]|nr:Gfo/Idh/MocA family oxidoreductase [Clostridia bacterium]
MKSVRIGIVGVGVIGTAHAFAIYNGEAEGLILSALCDNDKNRANSLKNEFPDVPVFEGYEEMIDSGLIDAIIIATPHYFHPIIATCAFKRGLDVLSEKPLGVYTLSLKKAFKAQKKSGKLYATMLNQRTNKLFMLAKEMVDRGDIGKLIRNKYVITNWYRTQEYYDSGAWRGTWRGEGGGVLINQAPHNLDIWQYICGMPVSLRAKCYEGKHHNIEVEDEATICAKYENGATGEFITSTGIENGVNTFEIVGDKGKILIERGRLVLEKNGKITAFEDEDYNGHLNILKNFANAILYGEKLIAPASEAVNELILSNGAYLSSWKNSWIGINFSQREYLRFLKRKIANSRIKESNTERENLFEKAYKRKWTTNW